MHDLVLSNDLARAHGIAGNLLASALPNFVECKGNAIRGIPKKKAALLHTPYYDIDDGALLELSRSGGAVVFSFSDILAEKGFRRAIIISKMRLLLSACQRAGCGFVFVSLAISAEKLRSKRELSAFASVVGVGSAEKRIFEGLLQKLAEGGRQP